jgi:TonB family protein
LQSYDDPAPFFFFGARVIIVFLLLGLAIFAGVYFYRHRSDAYLTRSYQYLQQRLSALRQPHTASTTATSPAETPVTPADSPIEIRPTPTPADSTPHLQPIVEVAASSMTGNVISAPKPTYPKLAQQNNTQGRVVLRATVSSDGNIQDIHGIKGPRLLQDAAVDAVSTWRYKPHLVHGKPMPVAILVTINFTLEPSPNNQQSKLTPSP